MILNYIYNSSEDVVNPLTIVPDVDSFEDLTINIYDISYKKDTRKGKAILNTYAARELPFIEITDNQDNFLFFSYAEARKEPLTKEYLTEIINNLNNELLL